MSLRVPGVTHPSRLEGFALCESLARSRLNETEGNLSLLKQALWKLVIFLEGKQAK